MIEKTNDRFRFKLNKLKADIVIFYSTYKVQSKDAGQQRLIFLRMHQKMARVSKVGIIIVAKEVTAATNGL